MTVPLILLAIPSIFARHRACRWACRWATEPGSAPLRAGWSRCSRARGATCTTTRPTFQLFGIDGFLILDRASPWPRSALVAGIFGCSASSGSRRPDRRRAPDHERQRRDPVPLPRLAQQVVVRRAQPPAVHRSSAGGSRRPVVVRPERSSTAPSTASASLVARRGRRAAADPDRPRPELRAGHRHRAARDGRLVPRDRGSR